jgi:hypothetical protein
LCFLFGSGFAGLGYTEFGRKAETAEFRVFELTLERWGGDRKFSQPFVLPVPTNQK